MPEHLPRLWVGQMDLDKRNGHGRQSVPERHALMRKRGRIDHDHAGIVVSAGVDSLQKDKLAIALQGCKFQSCGSRLGGAALLDIVKTGVPIHTWLTRAKQIQVWAIEQDDPGHSHSIEGPCSVRGHAELVQNFAELACKLQTSV